MSLYNLVNGVNPAAFFFLPLIGEGHHPDEFPRFRDCFLEQNETPEIVILTRTGGNNRDDYEEENEWIRSLSGFIADEDDDFDSTYARWRFAVPEQWQTDFTFMTEMSIGEGAKQTSPEYRALLRRVYPKLSEKWDELFGCPACNGSGREPEFGGGSGAGQGIHTVPCGECEGRTAQ